jgi:hypothetical protein
MNIEQIKKIKDGIVSTSANHKVIFASIIAETVPSMNKKGNPFYNSEKKEFIVKKKTETVVMLGNEYASAVQNRIEKNVEESQIENIFKSDKPSGKHFIDGHDNIILQSDKDKDVYYLRTYYNLSNNAPKTTYYVNGKVANEQELEEIKNWVKTNSYSAKQDANGLEEEKQVVVRDYKIKNVKKVKFGEFVIEE